MRDIVAVDEAVLPFAGDNVIPVLADLPAYSSWWPAPFRFETARASTDGGGVCVLVRQGLLLRWHVTLSAAESDHVALELSGGTFEGEAKWTTRPVLEGTALVLRVDVDVRSWWLRAWTGRRDVRRGHTHRMKRVFDALEAHLNRAGVPRLPAPQPPGPPPPFLG